MCNIFRSLWTTLKPYSCTYQMDKLDKICINDYVVLVKLGNDSEHSETVDVKHMY